MSAIKEFIALVQNNEFAPAHEVLEHDWKMYKKEGKKEHSKALQGLINGTTALALYNKGRADAYKKVWETFLKYQHLLDEITLCEKELYLEARELLYKKNQAIKK